MTVRFLFLQALVVMVAASTALGQDPPKKPQRERQEMEVHTVQDALVQAYIHRDLAPMNSILADDYIFIGEDGSVSTKPQIIAMFKSGEQTVTSYDRDSETVRVYGDAAVMTYHYVSKETSKGAPADSDNWFTRVFVRRGGQWQVVSGHETRVHKEPEGAAQRLLGTWRLLEEGTYRKDGTFEPDPEFGPHPIGYLMYDTTGHMCVSLANPNHPRWADAEKPTDAERLRSYDAYFGYCGRYEVREKEGMVVHFPEESSWPHFIGSEQERPYRLEGDRLILSGEQTAANGEKTRYRVEWQRVSGQ